MASEAHGYGLSTLVFNFFHRISISLLRQLLDSITPPSVSDKFFENMTEPRQMAFQKPLINFEFSHYFVLMIELIHIEKIRIKLIFIGRDTIEKEAKAGI